MIHKLQKDTIINIVFIIIMSLILLSFGLKLVLFGSKDINKLENRKAYQIPKFTIKTFFNRKYQEKLNNAVNDQLLGSEYIKKNAIKINNEMAYEVLKQFKSDSYYLVTNEFYSYGDSDYLLSPRHMDGFIEYSNDIIKKIADQYESINLEHKYLYLVNKEQMINFDNPNNDFYLKIIKYYPSFKTGYLKLDNYDDYKKYFYKTDHHWNYAGSYQGYKDIVKLMLGEEETPLKPVELVRFNYNIYGSKAKEAQFFKYKEKFSAYRFDMPEFDTYVNGKKTIFGHKELLFKNRNYKIKDGISYDYFYGKNVGEVIYDFKQPGKKNLLIIGYSDTRAIQELLASHYNKTYIIDLRFFTNFDVNNYIKENNITEFLLVSNWFSFTSKDSFLRK